MLQTIQDILFSIGDFFKGIGDFISDFFGDIVKFKDLFDKTIETVNVLIGNSDSATLSSEANAIFPTFFSVGIGLLLTVLLLLRVLGRD